MNLSLGTEVAARAEHAAERRVAFDVVVIGASAGGQVAVGTMLREFSATLPVRLLLMLHLPPLSDLVAVYRWLPVAVDWVQPGLPLQPGRLNICPPRSFVELLPDSTCVVTPCERGAIDRPIDKLFDSVARSFAHRAIGVVLSGMGADGAAGAVQLHNAGGRVLVQSPASCEYADMPRAAIAAGAADLVVPLQDLGPVVAELLAGTPRPLARSERRAIERVFGEHGGVVSAARELDWSATTLGAAVSWPEELRVTARTAMESPVPMAVFWGTELAQIYNAAWCELLGDGERPRALGVPARQMRPELWRIIGPLLDRAMARGQAQGGEDHPLPIDRDGRREEAYFTFSYSAIRDARGDVVGVHATSWETTRNVVAERRMRALRGLATQVAAAATPREACELAARALAADRADVPFALFYLADQHQHQATLAAVAGLAPGSQAAPLVLPTTGDSAVWPLARLLAEAATAAGARITLDDLAERLEPPALPVDGDETQPPRQAILLPLRSTRDRSALGMLVLGLSPHRPFDDGYRNFIDLVAQQTNAGIAEARAKQLERERLERLAELDRAKTEFFSNMSHEFRTPLTMLLAPLENLLRERERLAPPVSAELEVAARNARRLLRLVNSLLDFSAIDADRRPTPLELTDLARLTADTVSVFRSAFEAAGLALELELTPDLPPVPANRDMWETIVSNLLSNALKFTFTGTVSVRLRALKLHAELEVSDTGVGIPQEELLNLFKRFHRVPGARARTAEGSGIGLAIVRDLVRRLGGQITVRSQPDRGTTFTVWVPLQSRAPVEAAGNGSGARPQLAAELATEASRWLSRGGDDLVGPPTDVEGNAARAARGRLLVVDDNADIREYLERLLGEQFEVRLAGDGEQALAAARDVPPDVILADVMLPGMGGFEMLGRLRAEPRLQHTPVILLSARAGEVAAVEGLQAGADDYIAKPFSPRELVARVQVALQRTRADAALREREVLLTAQGQALEAALDDAPLEVSLGLLAQMAAAQYGADVRTAFCVANDEGTALHPVVGMGELYAEAFDGLEIGARSLACGLAAHTGQPVLTADVKSEPRWQPWLWMAEQFGYRGCWSFPVRTAAGRCVGSFAVHWREPHAATARDTEFASHVTRVAAIIIARHFRACLSRGVAASA